MKSTHRIGLRYASAPLPELKHLECSMSKLLIEAVECSLCARHYCEVFRRFKPWPTSICCSRKMMLSQPVVLQQY